VRVTSGMSQAKSSRKSLSSPREEIVSAPYHKAQIIHLYAYPGPTMSVSQILTLKQSSHGLSQVLVVETLHHLLLPALMPVRQLAVKLGEDLVAGLSSLARCVLRDNTWNSQNELDGIHSFNQ